MNKRTVYNSISWFICQLIKFPGTRPLFLKVYDLAFKTYYNFEKYRQNDPWLFNSEFQQNRIKTMISFISDKKYNNCLDIGCSNGYITSLIAPYCRKITGIDISDFAIAQAKKNYKNNKIKFIAESIRTFKFDPGYDLVILGDMLYCLSQNLPETIYLSVVENLCSHVKKGGRIVLTSYLPRSNKNGKFILGYSRGYLSIFKNFGFVIMKKEMISGTKEGQVFKNSVSLLQKT